ncbi:MAG TPA: hypothetical protein VJZ76_14185 [Thermoanaerobaculia bacterium]|nr:hypothetical protein [Thermoanaerobaculia bacterium]
MSTIPLNPGPAEEPANKYTPDAQDRMMRLRTMASEFPDEADPKALTPSEIRLARVTSAAALENAAVLMEAQPVVGSGGVANAVELRDAIAFEIAYGSVREEARALARRIDLAIMRRKLKAAKAARGLYRVAKAYVTVDAGEPVRPHVAEMKQALGGSRRRRKKPATTPAP